MENDLLKNILLINETNMAQRPTNSNAQNPNIINSNNSNMNNLNQNNININNINNLNALNANKLNMNNPNNLYKNNQFSASANILTEDLNTSIYNNVLNSNSTNSIITNEDILNHLNNNILNNSTINPINNNILNNSTINPINNYIPIRNISPNNNILQFTDIPNNLSINLKNNDALDSSLNLKIKDRMLPLANISKIMKRSIPPSGKIARDAKDLLQKSASEFIAIVTCRAKEICENETRKTVTGEDLIKSMEELDLPYFAEITKKYFDQYKCLTRYDRIKKGDDPTKNNFISPRNSTAANLAQIEYIFNNTKSTDKDFEQFLHKSNNK